MTSSFQTKRLFVSDLVAGDITAIRRIAADPEVMRYLLLWLDSEAEITGFLHDVLAAGAAQERRLYLQVVRERTGDAFAGLSYLEIETPGTSSAEIGYILLREHWGCGLATELLTGQLGFGFGSLGLHRIWGKCDELNGASARVMEKCGLQYEGTLREHIWLRDHWRSSRVYGMLAAEWQARQEKD